MSAELKEHLQRDRSDDRAVKALVNLRALRLIHSSSPPSQFKNSSHGCCRSAPLLVPLLTELQTLLSDPAESQPYAVPWNNLIMRKALSGSGCKELTPEGKRIMASQKLLLTALLHNK